MYKWEYFNIKCTIAGCEAMWIDFTCLVYVWFNKIYNIRARCIHDSWDDDGICCV